MLFCVLLNVTIELVSSHSLITFFTLGALVFLPFLSDYLRFSDTFIGILSSSGDALSHLFIALAATSTVVYLCNSGSDHLMFLLPSLPDGVFSFLAALGHVLSLGITVVIRSMLSKLVEGDEVSELENSLILISHT